MAPASITAPRTWRATLSAYISLMKPHVTVLLLGTTLAAMSVAAHGAPPLGLMLATLLGGAMAAGSANAINCWWDRDIDQLMSRTRSRPLPAGRVADTNALIFGLALGVGSTLIFLRFVNALSALLAVAAIAFYVGIYTMWLKRTTPQNIVIGGAAGAVPVLIGWSAVTERVRLAGGRDVPDHLLVDAAALLGALAGAEEGLRAGACADAAGGAWRGGDIPSDPVSTRSSCSLASTSLFFLHAMGYLYLVAAVVLGLGLLVLAIRLARQKTLADARTLFWCSNYYLALIFAMMVIDRILA